MNNLEKIIWANVYIKEMGYEADIAKCVDLADFVVEDLRKFVKEHKRLHTCEELENERLEAGNDSVGDVLGGTE